MKKTGVTVIAFKDKNDPTHIRAPMTFVEQHFNNADMPIPDEVERPDHTTTVTVNDLENALKLLSKGKAASFDMLNDRVLSRALNGSKELRIKVSTIFTNWLNGKHN